MKVFLFSIVFLLAGHFSFSQIWVKPNATWIFSYKHFQTNLIEFAYHYGYMKVKHEGDSLILGQNCKMLVSTEYHFSGEPGNLGDLMSITPIDTNYTYASGDTVFYYIDDQFRILYDFSMNSPDSLPIAFLNQTVSTGCQDTTYMHTFASGTELIASNSYRYVEYDRADPADWVWYELKGKFNDRFGPYEYYLFPNYRGDCNTNGYKYYDFKFLCFDDDELSVDLTTDASCPFFQYLNLAETKLDQHIHISPNPGDATLKINVPFTDQSATITILDLLGNILYENTSFLATELDTRFYANGMYFIRYKSNKHEETLPFVIKH